MKYGINHILRLWIFKGSNAIGVFSLQTLFLLCSRVYQIPATPNRGSSQRSRIGGCRTCKMFMRECLPGAAARGALLPARSCGAAAAQPGCCCTGGAAAPPSSAQLSSHVCLPPKNNLPSLFKNKSARFHYNRVPAKDIVTIIWALSLKQ